VTVVDQDVLPVRRVAELDLQLEQDRWLIEGLWGRSAIGLVGGAPKCCKTWLGLDLALSVASGTAAIGHFPVHVTGPALVYLAEDALPQVRARIESLCRHRGLDLDGLDLHVITAPVLRLDLTCDQQRLDRTIAKLNPAIVLLDEALVLADLVDFHDAEFEARRGLGPDRMRPSHERGRSQKNCCRYSHNRSSRFFLQPAHFLKVCLWSEP